MTGAVTIRVDGLGKKFCPGIRRSLLYAALDVAGEIVPRLRTRDRLRTGEFWALRGVSLEVRAGEALAVVGHNGAGKSTLLKILYGLLQADTGSATLHGPVVALIELGTGINPLLSARENIRLLGALHGLSAAASERIIAPVLDFGELHAVADTAVQTFSTGMRARLSYAIAAQLNPRVLLVDEVLAVGDLAFQRKCIAHMQRFLAHGGTLLLVSHAAHHIQMICTRAILLDKGEVVAHGPTLEVMRRYLEMHPVLPYPDGGGKAPGALAITDLRLEHVAGGPPRSGAPAVLHVAGEAAEALSLYRGFTLHTEDGWVCVTSSFDTDAWTVAPGSVGFTCEIAALPIVAGRYLVRVIAADHGTQVRLSLGGRCGNGVAVDIRGAPDLVSNTQMAMGQVLLIDTHWPASGDTIRRGAA